MVLSVKFGERAEAAGATARKLRTAWGVGLPCDGTTDRATKT